MNYKLRELKISDVNQITEVHIDSFKGFFLTSLGSDFLKVYYYSCLKLEGTIAFGIFDSNENLKGFAIGALNSSGYHKKILQYNLRQFIFCLTRIVFTRPKVILRLLLNLNKAPNKYDVKDYAELMSIAVLPSLKGSGYGKLLLDNFENKLKKLGESRCALTTDFYENELVVEFYKKNKYEIYYDFVSYPNRRMYKLIKKL